MSLWKWSKPLDYLVSRVKNTGRKRKRGEDDKDNEKDGDDKEGKDDHMGSMDNPTGIFLEWIINNNNGFGVTIKCHVPDVLPRGHVTRPPTPKWSHTGQTNRCFVQPFKVTAVKCDVWWKRHSSSSSTSFWCLWMKCHRGWGHVTRLSRWLTAPLAGSGCASRMSTMEWNGESHHMLYHSGVRSLCK